MPLPDRHVKGQGPSAAAGAATGAAAPGRHTLALLALLVLALLVASPWLIVPWRGTAVPWYESAAMFPMAALALALIGALGEIGVRTRSLATSGGGEELDAGASSPTQMLKVLALFAAYALGVPLLGFMASTALFVFCAAMILGLGLRRALWLTLPLALLLWVAFVHLLKVAFGHGWLL